MKCAFGVTGEVRMTECDHMLTELEEKAAKWQSARAAAEKAGAPERDTADFKIMDADISAFSNASGNASKRMGRTADPQGWMISCHKNG
jgi:hypothetical protein